MSFPASRGPPRTPAMVVVAASAFGTLSTASSFAISATMISPAAGRSDDCGFLGNLHHEIAE